MGNKITLAAAALATLGALTLAGCSADAPGGEYTPKPTGETSQNAQLGLAKHTELTSADTEPGEVTATGTVTLPEGHEPADVEITVSWVDSETGTQLAVATRTLDAVEAGVVTVWKVSTTLPETTATATVAVRSVIP